MKSKKKLREHKKKDATILYDDEQINDFNEISNWIDASNYPKLFSEIRVVEKQLEEEVV